VIRRLSALLIVWMGLLGAAHPALACATDMPANDCCPPGSNIPCDHSAPAPSPAPDGAICCVAAPAPIEAAASDRVRGSALVPQDSGSPEAIAQTSPLDLVPRPAYRHAVPPLAAPRVDDHSLTYLRTARLRL